MSTRVGEAPPIDTTTQATMLIDELVAALVNTRIYASSHPRVQGSIEAMRRRLAELAEQTGQDPICLGAADDLVVFLQRPLLGASIGAARLIGALRQWGAGGIELWAKATTAELEALLLAMVARPAPGQDYVWLNTQLVARQCRNAQLLPPYVDSNGSLGKTGTASGIRIGVQFYQAVVDLLQNVTVSVCRGGRIDFAPVQAQAEQVLKQLEAKDAPVLGLARQDQYDAFTFGHSVRVAVLSMNFARALTDDRDLLIRIGTAALLHDVGKSLIPFELLHSANTLSEEERRAMNRHAELGAECLLDHHDSDPLAIAAAFGHHRGPNGTGYPRTLHAHETTLVTSIVKICDVYEALTAARPYKQPMSPIRAYRVMLAMGDKLDQRLLQRFVHCNGVYPVGQFVELSTGEIAVVRGQTGSQKQPIVALVERPEGQSLARDEEQLFDLSQVECSCARAILAELAPQVAQERLVARAAGATAGSAPLSVPPPAPVTVAVAPAVPSPPSTSKGIKDPFRWD